MLKNRTASSSLPSPTASATGEQSAAAEGPGLRNLWGLWKKSGNVFVQLISYGFVGGSAALLDISIFGLLVSLGLDYRIANVFSFTGGTLLNFLLCNFFVFEKRAVSFGRAWLRHYFASIGGFIVNLTVLILLVELVFGDTRFWMLVSKLIATGCSFVANFIMIRFYVFNGKMSVRRLVRKILP